MFQKTQILIILSVFSIFILGGVGCVKIDFGGSGITGDGGVFKSVDKGIEWSQQIKILTTGESSKTISNINVLSFVFDPEDHNALYLGTEGNGLFYTYDGGEGWTQSPTLQRGSVASIAIDPSNKCIIYAALENKIIKSIDCSRSWKVIYYDSRPKSLATYVAVDPKQARVIYAGSLTGEVIKSSDGGVSWAPIGRFQNEIKKILVAPYNSSIIYVATASKGIFKSVNGGGSFEDLGKNYSKFNQSAAYKDLVFDLSADGSLVYASQFGLLKTADDGKTWNKIELLTPSGSAAIYSLAVSPKNGNDIFYSTATTFYRTMDGGKHWITKKLPSNRAASAILIDPMNPNIVYISVKKVK